MKRACQDDKARGLIPASDEATILEEAQKLIYGDRKEQYGQADTAYDLIAKLWAPIVGRLLLPQEVCLMMLQLKMARAIKDTAGGAAIKRDTIVDIAGYAGVLEQIEKGV